MPKQFLSSIFRTFLLVFILTSALLKASATETSLPQLYVTFAEDELNYDSYIPGTMELTDTDGTRWKLSTQFKTRGATALQYGLKPSLNMKLQDADGNELDTNLLGLRKASSFILDAMAIDRIKMRNRVAFDIWNDFSRLPYDTEFDSRNGTVGKFVEMYVNGKYKGIYCLSDKINRKLLDFKKPEVDENGVTIRGILYKNGTNDIEDQNNTGFFNDYSVWVAQWHDAWELHEPEDYASPQAWAPLVDLYENDNFNNYAYIQEHFWLENLADYTIHVMALCIADNWGEKNKYFSVQNVTKNDDRSRFVVTPWDLDTSFGGEWDGSKFDGDFKNDWAVADAEKKAPIPFGICLVQPEFHDILKQRWLVARAGSFSVAEVKRRLEETARLFVESGAWQRTIEAANPHDLITSDLLKEVELIGKWYEKRFDEMDRYLNVTEADINGVETIDQDNDDAAIYNVQGLRVSDMDSPGLYIVNGKKIIIK